MRERPERVQVNLYVLHIFFESLANIQFTSARAASVCFLSSILAFHGCFSKTVASQNGNHIESNENKSNSRIRAENDNIGLPNFLSDKIWSFFLF